ncbi:uncharacterized protein LOC143019970 [Oratosquilla oratoria]|uniref:uncharacterized protein LOC143019970 n=1 Tax=Oratosquilla oratoria TaxID=337810 RepID=UPI003F767FCD
MLGDVLDWDTGLVLLHLIARTMGLRGSKGGPPPSEVGTSASPPPPPKEVTAPSHGIRTSPAPPSVAPAAPLLSTSTPQESPGVSESGKGKGVSQPVQEGIITKKADTEDNVTSQDKLASSEVVSNSCTKDTDATSLTEDSSFASCLTDPSTSLSEDGKVKVDSTSQPPVEVSQTSEAALSAKSTDDSPLTSVFKEASCLENQLRKSLVTPLGSQTKLSGDEGTPTKDDTPPSLPSPQHKASPPPERRSPPREERSAPEGTSSPTPRSNESAEHKNNNNSGRGKTSVPSGYMSSAQVEELLKQQELQFEEKLLRVELSAGEKEKQLRHSMKE